MPADSLIPEPIFIERIYALLERIPKPLMLAIAAVGHYVMETRMLNGIKRRAERLPTSSIAKTNDS